MKRKILFPVIIILWVCVTLVCIAGNVRSIGTDYELYYELQTRAGLPESAGISAEDLKRLDSSLACCLKGFKYWNTEQLSPNGAPIRVAVDGVEQEAFYAREIAHMDDCQHLFELLRNVERGFGIAALVLALVAVALNWKKKYENRNRLKAMWIGSLLICAPLMAFGVWAAIDFDAAFTFFHHLLFTNDLWLLDPATDLLIRICPQSMFAEMGLRIARRAAFVLLGVPLALTILEWAWNRPFKWISDMRKRKKRA